MEKVDFSHEIARGKDGAIYNVSNDPNLLYKELFQYKTPSVFTDAVDRDQRSFFSSELNTSIGNTKACSEKELMKIPRIISNLKLNNFVKIIALYDKFTIRRSNPGYVMKKYTPSIDYSRPKGNGEYKNKSLLDFKLSYLIDNYLRLQEDIDLLWKKGISLRDHNNIDNYIITDDGIMFIDVDGYALVNPLDRLKNKMGFKKISVRKADVNGLISSLIRNALDYLEEDRRKDIMQPTTWTSISNRDNFNLLEDLYNYDSNMTIYDYLKIKTEELENKKVK